MPGKDELVHDLPQCLRIGLIAGTRRFPRIFISDSVFLFLLSNFIQPLKMMMLERFALIRKSCNEPVKMVEAL